MRSNLAAVLGRADAAHAHESDAALLDRFARVRDEAAFAALVGRHGPMVLSACRRVLGDPQAAEDAFQATFLVLARKAASLPRPDALAGWLYGVARRASLKARSVPRTPATGLAGDALPADRRRDPLAELTGRELLAILQDEIDRLPAAYRLAVVLCCLDGLTVDEAASRLNSTPGSVRGRLERGRARLHGRLAARGLVPASVLAIAAMAQAARAATAGLRLLAVRGAVRFVTHAGAAEGVVPEVPRRIAEGVLNAMLMTKLKIVGCGAVAAILAAGPVWAESLLGLGKPAAPVAAEVAAAGNLRPLRAEAKAPGDIAKADRAPAEDRPDKADDHKRGHGTDKDGEPKHDGIADKDGNPKADDDHGGGTDKDGNPKRGRGVDKDGNAKEGHGDKKDDGREKGPKSEHANAPRGGK